MSEIAAGDCGVCIGGDYGDGESAEFYDAKVVRARKVHRCCECRREIAIGVTYRKETGKFDGEIFSFKTCMVCDELKQCLSCDGPPPMFECLWDEIVDYVFPQMTTGCLQKLKTAAAKEYLVERWNKWKFRKLSASAGSREKEKMTMIELEDLGTLIDRLDNLAHALRMPLPDKMHVDILRDSLPKLVTSFKAAYAHELGNDPWETHPKESGAVHTVFNCRICGTTKCKIASGVGSVDKPAGSQEKENG